MYSGLPFAIWQCFTCNFPCLISSELAAKGNYILFTNLSIYIILYYIYYILCLCLCFLYKLSQTVVNSRLTVVTESKNGTCHCFSYSSSNCFHQIFIKPLISLAKSHSKFMKLELSSIS